ncbi:MAG: TadE/TadG family type IV pilus assembly protein [Verrucomicrobia bacterium]|nr:TadE/TadG family type IV pilus assembly protein [Verrucomicrobiota bacterium]MDA1086847.1 TadE/TadG family type IV pilus assembly protein [Verrucomicrobiota bacterium]
MKLKKTDGFIQDERGQAIVESVLVVPVVLFVFFAMFQFILYANVAQLGNFAAYSAARSMSVHLAAGEASAIKNAKIAGAVAYAPLSQPAPGEVAHYTGVQAGVETAFISNFLKNTMDITKDALETFAGMQTMGPDGMEGPLPNIPNLNGQDEAELRPLAWLFTALGRLKFVAGQDLDWTVRNISGPALQEVNVELHYEYPMYIPGFSELWNYLPGESTEEASDVTPLHEALGSIFTVVIHTKCSMGIEGWSGQVITTDGTGTDTGDPTADPYAGISETADELAGLGAELEQRGQEMKVLEDELQALKDERASCLADADDFDETTACHAEWDPKINAKQNQIDDLGEVIEDIQNTMEGLYEDIGQDAADAADQGIENINAALDCDG